MLIYSFSHIPDFSLKRLICCKVTVFYLNSKIYQLYSLINVRKMVSFLQMKHQNQEMKLFFEEMKHPFSKK